MSAQPLDDWADDEPAPAKRPRVVWPTGPTFPRKPGSYQWMKDAACQGQTELFFMENPEARQQATDICLLDCPVLDQCRPYDYRVGAEHRIWAGTTGHQRRR